MVEAGSTEKLYLSQHSMLEVELILCQFQTDDSHRGIMDLDRNHTSEMKFWAW